MKATQRLRAFIRQRRQNGRAAVTAVKTRIDQLRQKEDRGMKATDLLKAQHREVLATLEQMDGTEDKRELRKMFEEIAGKLAAHDKIERQIFYPACEEIIEDQEVLHEAYTEHGILALALVMADNVKSGDASFKARIKVVREMVEKHVEEEESDVLKAADKGLGDERLQDLGDEMSAMFDEALGEPYRPALERLLGTLVDEGSKKPGAKAGAKRSAASKPTARPSRRASTARRGGGKKRVSTGGARKKTGRAGQRKSR